MPIAVFQTILARPVRVWLLAGVVMVFFQVIIGGVTRLTDSGLSITDWAVIQGTLPPLNEQEWETAFEAYKLKAKRQYEALHAGMTMREFKFIFFWEYVHRLWARLMAFVFLIPFFWFLYKKRLPGWLLRRLGIVIALAALAAVFGWIMVASGLSNDKRTWVSAYKLIIHLAIATALFGYLFWTWLMASQSVTADNHFPQLKRLGWVIASVLFLQIIFGGLMAGMKAALIHPHFPVFVEGERLWSALKQTSVSSLDQIVDYESHRFVKAIVQLLHRGAAWVLAGLIVFFFLKAKKFKITKHLKLGLNLLVSMLIIQFLLGVFTVTNSVGRIPLFLGVAHQAGALMLLAVILSINYLFSRQVK